MCGRFGNSPGVPHPCPQDPGAAGPGGWPCDSPKPTSRAPRTSCSTVYLSTHLVFLLARWHSEFFYLLAFAHAVSTAQRAFSCLGFSTCQGALPHPKLAQGLYFPRKSCPLNPNLLSYVFFPQLDSRARNSKQSIDEMENKWMEHWSLPISASVSPNAVMTPQTDF